MPEHEHTFGRWDVFVHPDDDPRADGGFDNTGRAMLVGYLADRRLTLESKCRDLDAAAMAQRSGSPSDLSLLGHLAGVGLGKPVPLREVTTHLLEEYARHLGHADLLRERIDGRVGR